MGFAVGELLEIALDMRWQGQQVMNVWQYEVQNWPLSVTAVQAAEGWWNHVKATYRALQVSTEPDTFLSVKLRALNNPTGDYAEFDVPTAEKVGTRGSPGAGGNMPPFSSAGVRLVVGTRVTRPGQKRVPFLREEDNSQGVLQAAFRTLVNTWAAVMVVPMVLGAPAALTDLYPVITRKNATGFVSAHQYITGYLINNNITTQNTRKFGRGS